jgi:hypothetical protein
LAGFQLLKEREGAHSWRNLSEKRHRMKTLEKLSPRFLVASAVLTILALSANTATAAGVGSFTPIDYPGAVATYAWGINPAGDIVGGYRDVSQNRHGYLLSDGTFTSFDYPGAAWTEAWGISPRGDIVGQSGGSDRNPCLRNQRSRRHRRVLRQRRSHSRFSADAPDIEVTGRINDP